MVLFWVSSRAASKVTSMWGPPLSQAKVESSTAFMALRTSPPQWLAMWAHTPSSGRMGRPSSSASTRKARSTAFSISPLSTALNSNTVERLKMALYT